jgi:type VI protein secretion system component Hcp
MSTTALVLALSGTATATAAVLVTGAMIKDETVTSADVKNGSLKAKDFAKGQLPTGAAGPEGEPGETGPAGPEGSAGPQGPVGPRGAAGVDGANGAVGATGATGVTGAQGQTGRDGAAAAIGATGATGATGLSGVQGATGAAGVTGATGLKGVDGVKGATGAQGVTGATGATGARGPAGPAAGEEPKIPVGLLTLDGMTGQRADGAMVVSDISWKAQAESSWTKGGGASIGKLALGELSFTMPADSTTSALWAKIVRGQSIASGTLALTADSSAAPYAKIALSTMFVTEITPRTEKGVSVERVSLVVNPGATPAVPPTVLTKGPAPVQEPQVGTVKFDDAPAVPISFVTAGAAAPTAFDKGAGPTVGKPSPGPIVLRKGVDAASAVLRTTISQGKPFEKVVIDIPSAGAGQPHIVYTLENAFLTEVSLQGNGGSIEEIQMVNKVLHISTTFGNGKPVFSCWDIPKGTGTTTETC